MKDSLPPWLPALVCLEDFGGDVTTYIERLFKVFSSDFVSSKPIFNGSPVLFDNADDGGKPRVFNHITTESDRKTLAIRRCERIGWIKPIIENVNDPAVLFWEQDYVSPPRYKSKRLYFFLEQDDFLIILEEHKIGHFIITAIYVDYPHQKRKHLKAYEEYKNTKNHN